jgi:hypothetical protein
MVGQTMRPKGREFHYYCCRAAFARQTSKQCSGRNIRAERLEEGIWREVWEILSDPRIVLNELDRAQSAAVDEKEVADFERELGSVVAQQTKLAELFTLGAVDSDVVQAQGAPLKQCRAALESRLTGFVLRPTRRR